MKRICIVLLAVLTISQICNAQINNPTVYVTENGSSNITYGTGGYFGQPITESQFMNNVYNGEYSGNITVRFAGGDYHGIFVFHGIPNNIQSIKMYGGWNPNAPINKRGYDDRDFYNYETRFHATGSSDVVSFNAVGHYHPNGAGICIIDGITFTDDGDDYSAISLYYGDHVISQCKFENFNTSTWLIWMETAGHTVTYTSCLFAQNEAKHLMALCTHADLINVTIADNDFTDDMFLPFSSYNLYTQTYSVYYYYNLYNSIIYGNNNMYMEHDLTSLSNHVGFFDVYNSILENNEGWINDMANNLIGSIYDPIFNTYSAAPYSCDYYSSPAIGMGASSFITSSPFYDPNIMDYDVVNMYRYFDFYAIKTDIGAYQNGYEDGTHLYSVGPVFSTSKRYSNDNTGSDLPTISTGDIQGGAILTIYDVSGKIVGSTTAVNNIDALTATISSGIYVVVVVSKEGQKISSKKIVIP